MQITDLNLSTRQVRAFTALAEHRNFTRAAEQCHLSQSAFSSLIRTLEDSLGVRLFDRDTRRVELTPEGRLFLGGATRVLASLRDALEDLGEHSAALPSLAAGWMPGVLAAFHQEYPGIQVDVADVLSESCIEFVRSGRADFALASMRSVGPDLQAEPFCRDGFYLVCRKDHPLSRRRRLTLPALSGEPFIHLAQDSSVRQHIEAAIHPAKMNGMMELDQLSTVAGMVRAGLGITVVPALTLFHFDSDDLTALPVETPGLTREVFVIRRRDRSLSIGAQALLAFMMQRRPEPGERRGSRRGAAPPHSRRR